MRSQCSRTRQNCRKRPKFGRSRSFGQHRPEFVEVGFAPELRSRRGVAASRAVLWRTNEVAVVESRNLRRPSSSGSSLSPSFAHRGARGVWLALHVPTCCCVDFDPRVLAERCGPTRGQAALACAHISRAECSALRRAQAEFSHFVATTGITSCETDARPLQGRRPSLPPRS